MHMCCDEYFIQNENKLVVECRESVSRVLKTTNLRDLKSTVFDVYVSVCVGHLWSRVQLPVVLDLFNM